jgi:hypothetical protein
MPKGHPPSIWASIRADYVAGLGTTNDLARTYGVDASGIRKRRILEAWPEPGERIVDTALYRTKSKQGVKPADQAPRSPKQQAGTHFTPEGVKPMEHPGTPPRTGVLQKPRTREQALLMAAEREFVRDLAIIDAIAPKAAALIEDHLARTAQLKQHFTRLHTLLGNLIHDDPQKRATAQDVLGQVPPETVLNTMLNLASSIQRLERQSLQLDMGPRRLELTGKDGAPLPATQVNVGVGVKLDAKTMTTEQLAALGSVLEAVDGQAPRTALKRPPQGPMIEG